jgi:hypothetical protein
LARVSFSILSKAEKSKVRATDMASVSGLDSLASPIFPTVNLNLGSVEISTLVTFFRRREEPILCRNQPRVYIIFLVTTRTERLTVRDYGRLFLAAVEDQRIFITDIIELIRNARSQGRAVNLYQYSWLVTGPILNLYYLQSLVRLEQPFMPELPYNATLTK